MLFLASLTHGKERALHSEIVFGALISDSQLCHILTTQELPKAISPELYCSLVILKVGILTVSIVSSVYFLNMQILGPHPDLLNHNLRIHPTVSVLTPGIPG
jgi:hypothetical protein